MWEYSAEVVRVVDGDTVDVDIDLGFHHRFETRLRLSGINAPEINAAGTKGEESRDYLKSLLSVGSKVRVVTIKDRTEKYGRYLANIFVDDGHGGHLDVNASMISSGHAVAYMAD